MAGTGLKLASFVRPSVVAASVVSSLLVAATGVALLRSHVRLAIERAEIPDKTLIAVLANSREIVLFATLFAIALAASILPMFAFARIRRRMSRSLGELRDAAGRASDGLLHRDLPLPDDEEVAEMAHSINLMRRALLAKIAEVEEERRLVLSLVSGMREGLVWVGPGRRIRLANDTFRQIFLVSGDPTGRLLAEVVRHPGVMRELDTALTEGSDVREAVFQMPGSGRSFEIHVTPLTGRDLPGALVLFFDVTRLEALERVRRDFVANVSHELRTPLTSIKAFVETLIEEGLEDRVQSLRFLEIVRKHADRMGELIDDLTDLSQIETGAIALDVREIDAHALASDVVSHISPRHAAANVEVINAIPEPFPVRADRRRLEQILVNLVDNAIKFNRPGGSVRIGGSREGDRPVVWIEDTGTGIPADSVDKVFNRFYRVDKARSRDVGGTGLGLAIVKHLMRLHGGQVRLDSEPGKGSKFTLEFPPPAAN